MRTKSATSRHGLAAGAATLLLLLGAVGACRATNPLEGIESQEGWQTQTQAPQLKAGDLRPKALWNDPEVLKEDGRYVMYMTTSVEEPFKPPVLPFRAVSKDGENWALEPKTPLLQPKGTPFVSLETPTVVRFQGRYHMYFTGVYPAGQVPPMAIGHAVSDDGIRWSVDPEPVLTATGTVTDWNGYLVAEPGALVLGDRLYLYFTALGARKGGNPPQWQTIGLVTSADGRRFDAPRSVLSQSERYPAERGFVGYSTPAPFLLDGRVHLVYDVVHFERGGNPEWRQIALHHAWSADGERGFIQDPQPIFTRADFPWTSGEILAPAPLVDGDQLKLWFAGHVAVSELAPLIRRQFAGPEFGIGMARMDLERFRQNLRPAPAAPPVPPRLHEKKKNSGSNP